MRWVTFERNGAPAVGVVIAGRVVDLGPIWASIRAAIPSPAGPRPWAEDMISLLAAGPQGMAAVADHVRSVQQGWQPDRFPALAATTLLAPIPRPGKIVAIGRNYGDHAAETGAKPFEVPRIIAKLPSSVVGPGAVVRRPAGVAKLDYEVELAVVMGRMAKEVSTADALAYVAGYTILDDVSAREFQFDVSPAQTTFAKSMDGFCPMGPWLVTRDEIADPQHLDLKCWVNGELLQDGNTHDMIFDVRHLIEYITRFMTLEPGDVIATGTPAGVGAFRKPPRWLQPGDRVRMEVAQIGVLEHSIG